MAAIMGLVRGILKDGALPGTSPGSRPLTLEQIRRAAQKFDLAFACVAPRHNRIASHPWGAGTNRNFALAFVGLREGRFQYLQLDFDPAGPLRGGGGRFYLLGRGVSGRQERRERAA